LNRDPLGSPEYLAGDSTALWDVVFATSPPTRARSQTLTPVRIGDRDYKVWSFGETGAGPPLWFVVHQ
jgi:hypothetical protein